MNKITKRLARILPDDILFGESFRFAKAINDQFELAKDKIDFIKSYQNEKLGSLLKLAVKAPLYACLGNATPENFENLPIINKATVLQRADEILLSKRAADYITTGGTTGKPLGFYINKNRKGFEWFWMTNNWSKVGFKTKDYRAVLRNHSLGDKKFEKDYLLREIRYNNFSLNDSYADFIIAHVAKNRIKFLHAYPSAAFSLAKRIKENKGVNSLKTFLCGSEPIHDFQKKLIQIDLNIRMYTWYGHSEKLILAGEGEECENYHSNPFYGIAELIDENGKRITESGKRGELVGTGFINTKMPFIRYNTEDSAEYVGEFCPNCGHIGLTFKKVLGRWGESIYKSDGSVITTTALNLHSELYKYIAKIQYVQEEKGKLLVYVVPDKEYDLTIQRKLYNELNSKSGSGLEIIISEIGDIVYTKNNKYQLLIQKIKDTKNLT